MARSDDGSAWVDGLLSPPCDVASHSMAAGFPGEHSRSEGFKKQEAEVKGYAQNCDNVISTASC